MTKKSNSGQTPEKFPIYPDISLYIPIYPSSAERDLQDGAGGPLVEAIGNVEQYHQEADKRLTVGTGVVKDPKPRRS